MQSLLELQRVPVARLNLSRALNPISSRMDLRFHTGRAHCRTACRCNARDFAYAVHTDIGHACVGARVAASLTRCRSRLLAVKPLKSLRTGCSPECRVAELCRQLESAAKIRQLLKNLKRDDSVSLGLVCSTMRWVVAVSSMKSRRKYSARAGPHEAGNA